MILPVQFRHSVVLGQHLHKFAEHKKTADAHERKESKSPNNKCPLEEHTSSPRYTALFVLGLVSDYKEIIPHFWIYFEFISKIAGRIHFYNE